MGKVVALAGAPPLTLADLAREPGRAADVQPEAIPPLMAQCAALQSALAARLAAPPQTPNESRETPMLSMSEVAERLGVRISYAYALTRTGRLPCIRFGKYVRVEPRALTEWIDAQEQAGSLDSRLDATYSPHYDRPRTSTATRETPVDSSSPREEGRRQRQQHRPPRARRNGDQRTTREANQASGPASHASA